MKMAPESTSDHIAVGIEALYSITDFWGIGMPGRTRSKARQPGGPFLSKDVTPVRRLK